VKVVKHSRKLNHVLKSKRAMSYYTMKNIVNYDMIPVLSIKTKNSFIKEIQKFVKCLFGYRMPLPCTIQDR